MEDEIILRHPTKEDGLTVFNLIKASPPLDLNSSYYYYMMCADFGKSSLVAERGGELLGYISGYIPPEDEGTLFVWQVAVSEAARGKGLAGALLSNLVQDWNGLITTLKTTISPSNKASQALFKGFAEKNEYPITTSEFLKASDFGPGDHESEELYTIKLK